VVTIELVSTDAVLVQLRIGEGTKSLYFLIIVSWRERLLT